MMNSLGYTDMKGTSNHVSALFTWASKQCFNNHPEHDKEFHTSKRFSSENSKKVFVFLLFFGMVQIGKFPPSLQTHNCLQTVIFIYLYQTVYI